MALDVTVANAQANQLNNDIIRLNDAKKQLLSYRSLISDNWQAKEVTYIVRSINKMISEIDTAIMELEALAVDIKNVAETVRREELAAEAAARAERAKKEENIRRAQEEYDQANDELEKLREKMDKMLKRAQTASLKQKIGIAKDIDEMQKRINEAEAICEEKLELLRAAKR